MDKKVIISLIIVLATILCGYYCWTYTTKLQPNSVQIPTSQTNTLDETLTENVNNNPTSSNQASVPKTYNVLIKNFAFNPKTLSINKGDTVLWTNDDSAPHNVVGDDLADLNSPVMTKGQSYSFTFTNVGTFNYTCTIHPSMTASLIVK